MSNKRTKNLSKKQNTIEAPTMRALSVRQPWAYLICVGKKKIEYRIWDTKYRGKILIHASSRRPSLSELAEEGFESADDFVYSAIIGEAELVNVKHNEEYDDYEWILKRPLLYKTPIPCHGKLKLWSVPPEIKKKLKTVLKK